MKTKKSYFSKALVLLMAVMMVFTMMPSGMWGGAETAWAAEESPSVTVTQDIYASLVTVDAETKAREYSLEKTLLSVNSGIAEKYGYKDSTKANKEVSALDVLVTVMEQTVGSSRVKSILNVTDSGWVTLYGSTGNSFAIDGYYPSDGEYGSYGYNGTTVSTQAVIDGQYVEFFMYADTTSYQDAYTWFSYAGKAIDEIYIQTNQDYQLKVNSYGSYPYFGASRLETLDSKTFGVAGARIYTQENGITDINADENGNFTLNISDVGDYKFIAMEKSHPGPSHARNCHIILSMDNFYDYMEDWTENPQKYCTYDMNMLSALTEADALEGCECSHCAERLAFLQNKGNNYEGYLIPPMLVVHVVDQLSSDQAAFNIAQTLNWRDIKSANDVTFGVSSDLELESTYSTLPEGTKITWTSSNPTVIDSVGKVNKPSVAEGRQIIKLTANVSYNGGVASKVFFVYVSPDKDTQKYVSDLNETIERLAEYYHSNQDKATDWWVAVAMSKYSETNPNSQYIISDENKQNAVNLAIENTVGAKTGNTKATDERATVNTLMNATNLLAAYGKNPTDIISLNKTNVNGISKLSDIDVSLAASAGYFETLAPYAILALRQNSQDTEKVESQYIDYLLGKYDEEADGWSVKFGVDTTAMVLHGLAPYYHSDARVKRVVDEALVTLSNKQKTDGGYGNVASSSVVLIALSELGINAKTDDRFIKDNHSILDYIVSKYTDEKQLGNPSDTKQGMIALIAANQVIATETAYNPFDFSTTATKQAIATAKGNTTTPSTPTGDSITVKMSIKNDTGTYWMYNQSVTIPGTGATAYHAFVKACADAGITHVGAESGYVRSMTKDGKTLAEFTNGENSGWLYKVNGTLPDVGLTSCSIKNGDNILWYYTNDWTKDPDAGKHFSSTEQESGVTTDTKTGTTTAPTEVKVTEKANADGTKTKVAEVKVSADNQKEILKQAKANKSKEIILSVATKAVGEATKADVTLDKSFIDSIVKDTDAKLTVKTPFGDKTYTQEELKALSAAATGTTVTIAVEKAAEEPAINAKELAAKLTPVARSAKTAKKNVKVTVSLDKQDKEILSQLTESGYTVKYRFFRSTKKSASYKSTVTKKTTTYTNTSGKKGTKYFYKVQVRVYDENGKLVATTALKQCKYASRTWSR